MTESSNIRQRLRSVGVEDWAISEMDYCQVGQPDTPGWFINFDDLDVMKKLDEKGFRALVGETNPSVGDKGFWWPA